jgi:hypothetical protein
MSKGTNATMERNAVRWWESMADAKHSSRSWSWQDQGALETFQSIRNNFVVAAKAVIDLGGIVAIEWPERCKYWLDPRVCDFLEHYQFGQQVFRGCAYGLVTRYNLPLHTPMKKLWRCSSNNPKILTYLDKKCVGDHTRAECGGGD